MPINFQFLQIFRTSFNINTSTEKNIFVHGFSFFLMDYLKPPPPHPLNDENPPVTKKVFCQCSLKG